MPNAGPLAGRRILLIEDDFLVGQVTVDMLEEEGATVLGPVGSVDDALAFIAEQATQFDHAVLDLNLHGVKSYPVADELVRRNIAFVFMTGYGRNTLDEAHRDYPHCIKPVTRADLLAALVPK